MAKLSKSQGPKIVLTLAKDGPQALADCHVGIRGDAGIRNLKSEGLTSAVWPRPLQNPDIAVTLLLQKMLILPNW